MTISEIRRRNADAGFCWFEPGTMRFFHSRVGRTTYALPDGRVAFVSSEQFFSSDGSHFPRRYTVRLFTPATGDVDTHGDFNRLSRSQAHRLARALAKGGV